MVLPPDTPAVEDTIAPRIGRRKASSAVSLYWPAHAASRSAPQDGDTATGIGHLGTRLRPPRGRLALTEKRSSANADGIFEPFSIEDVPWEAFSKGERNPNDVIVYTDSGRVGVRLTGEGYRKSATMDYWEVESA